MPSSPPQGSRRWGGGRCGQAAELVAPEPAFVVDVLPLDELASDDALDELSVAFVELSALVVLSAFAAAPSLLPPEDRPELRLSVL